MKYTFDEAFKLYEKKQFAEALKILEQILNGGSKDADAMYLRAIIDFKLGNLLSALKYFEMCSEKSPLHAETHYNIGLCNAKLGKADLAVEHYMKAIELNPKHTNSMNNLGALYFEQKKLDEAETLYRRALEIEPNNNNAMSNLGNVSLARNKPEEAISLYKRAIETKPGPEIEFNFASAYNNIGFVKIEYGSIDEAFEYFDKAIEIDSGFVEAYFNKARAYLLKGDFEKGWHFYEWRTKRKDFGVRKFAKPLLTDQEISGKTVLIYAEQGLGDTIQFIRYLPLLKKKGARVVFECSKKLTPLFAGYKGYDEIIEQTNDAEPQVYYDYQMPLLSLPHYFKTDLTNIPGGVPYVFAKETLVKQWQNLTSRKDKIKVGIAWAGNPGHIRDNDRSCKITDFLPLFSVPEVDVYIIQKGNAKLQTKDILEPFVNLNNYNFDEKEPFFDTAAVIENLDLVVTVDTSIAHLAGAMNKPVWVALSHIPDWRWMLDKNDSPWYPSMRLFRQPKHGDWHSVFQNIKNEINNCFIKQKNIIVQNENLSAAAQQAAALPAAANNEIKNLYLGLSSGENFGWGVCSNYLKKELGKKLNVINLDEHKEIIDLGKTEGSVFHALTDLNFNSMFNVRGTINYGYTFFENELTNNSVANAKNYDAVFAGSTWCKNKMTDKGIYNSNILIQGIDPELFYPIEEDSGSNLFKIFSGGKFELRKGQDLVLKAFKVLQDKYEDVVLINAWYNIWPATMQSMSLSKHIRFELSGANWLDQMRYLCKINEIKGERILTLPLTPNTKMRELYKKTDIGLFPNRCEGGTNLVLMEYMACAKPVIASFNSGHMDILTEENSYPLFKMNELKLYDPSKNLICDWEEPDLDEIIAALEFAYHNRDAIKQKGKEAGENLKELTWTNSAESLLENIKL